MMTIHVNGAPMEVSEGATCAQLIELLGLTGRRVAVEVNLEIVPRSTFADRPLAAGDRVEVVQAIGGG